MADSQEGQKVHIRVPKKGTKEKLVELAQRNAEIVLSQDRERLKREEGRTIGAVKEIGGWLGIEPPERIEAYDISNISGFQSVGSMVVYEKGNLSGRTTANSGFRPWKAPTITPVWKRF